MHTQSQMKKIAGENICSMRASKLNFSTQPKKKSGEKKANDSFLVILCYELDFFCSVVVRMAYDMAFLLLLLYMRILDNNI